MLQKLNGLGLKIANKFKLSYIPFLPVTLDIEPINICNFKCEHCKVTYWKKEKRVLNFEKFKNILGQFHNLKSIKLQGLGEPLLNNELPVMINYAGKKGIKIEFFTNGSIYNELVWSEINNSNNVHVIFSVDAASKDVFEEIRKEANFDLVLENIKKIIIGNETKYSFWTVLNKKNLEQLHKIIELSQELGIAKIGFQTFLNDWYDEEVKTHNNNITLNSLSILNENVRLARKTADKYGLELQIYKENYLSKKQKCSWPFTSAFIASNGDVVPCCVIADSDVLNMGNLFETPFKKIWNSKKYKDFRKSISMHELNDVCKKCYGEDV